jgi:hypothetical protein
MKKNILRNFHQLQVLEDGSSFYIWAHPLNSRLLLRSNDITANVFWNEIEFDLKKALESISISLSDIESGSESD